MFSRPPTLGQLFTASFALQIAFLQIPAHAVPGHHGGASSAQAPDTQASFFVQYENGLVSMRGTDVALATVLESLKVVAGVEVHRNSASIGTQKVSVSIAQAPIDEAIKIVLSDSSYALYSTDGSVEVFVLSSTPGSTKHQIRSTSVQGLEPLTAGSPESTANHDLEPSNDVYRKQIPTSLDDFYAITDTLVEWETPTESARTNSTDWYLTEREHEEMLVDRALDTLSSEHEHLYPEAVNALVDSNDQRATETLIEAAKVGIYWLSREAAIEALWSHIVNRQFADTSTIAALDELTRDPDKWISETALRALQEVNRFKNERAKD